MNALIKVTAFAVVVALSSSSIVKSPTSSGDNFELLILHNNDMHARFEQTSQLSGTCTTEDREAGKCYGGFPRVAYVVKEARRKAASGEGPPVLYLNAGDTYTGTAWFTIYKWKVAAEFINALQPDAVSLGNHEFDEEVDGVVPFIRNLTTPVLAANLLLNNVPELQTEKNLHTSIVIPVNGTKVGIIGYLTSETKYLAPKNKVEYEDEVIAIRREVSKLKKDGVNILIALGHSGYIKDLKIAKEVDGLDLVVGGHSNTFLWNSNKTEEIPEIPQGPYPKVVKQTSGKTVLVVQAYAYTKYMGRLHMIFNKNGEVIKYDGTPLLLNQDIPRDPELLATVDKYQRDVNNIYSEVVGISMVSLNGDCRLRECNLGDLITDAVVDYTQQKYTEDLSIAIIQGGRIRISIDRPSRPFEMTRGDWITALPFSDSCAIVTMSGKILRQALEHSASTWREIDSTGQFLQLSGLRVVYDLAKPPGSRVIDAVATCSGCGKPGLNVIEDSYEYKVAMPIFLAEGGDGYTMFETLDNEPLPFNEVECVFNYVKKYGPVDIHTSNRIKLVNEDEIKLLGRIEEDTAPSSAFSHYSSSSRISLFIVIFSYVYFSPV